MDRSARDGTEESHHRIATAIDGSLGFPVEALFSVDDCERQPESISSVAIEPAVRAAAMLNTFRTYWVMRQIGVAEQ